MEASSGQRFYQVTEPLRRVADIGTGRLEMFEHRLARPVGSRAATASAIVVCWRDALARSSSVT
jgi:hypothetical protein